MKCNEINIRDPFVLYDGGKYYMYGTRAENFGQKVGGFDVYVSDNLIDWSEPHECFNSENCGMNRCVNWAPEVHKYKDSFYMFATFTKENGLRGTYVLNSDTPYGQFKPYSDGALTPYDWECLDGTLYIDENDTPYLVFCHEHTQIIDGAVCAMELDKSLKRAVGKPVDLFNGSTPEWADKKVQGEHYITDGPFMFKTKNGTLLMIWSTFIGHKYAQCIAKSDTGKVTGPYSHPTPIITDDGGHGMIFNFGEKIMLTYHSPNNTGDERPLFREISDLGNTIALK